MKNLRLIAVALVIATFAAALAIPAFAESTVTIPSGEWAAGLSTFVNELVLVIVPLLLTFIANRFAGSYVTAEMIKRVEQVLVPAIQWGVNRTAQGIPPSIDVSVGSSPVVAHALEYVLKWAPAYLIKWMGGVKGIEAKIIARVDMTLPAKVLA